MPTEQNQYSYPILIEYSDDAGNPAYYYSESLTIEELQKEINELSRKYACDVTATRFQPIDEYTATYIPNPSPKY